MADDHIHLVDHNPLWAQHAADEIRRLKRLLHTDLILQIEHVGSTSIPGIKAKPILDINILVKMISAAHTVIEPIKSLGYQFWEDNPDRSKMFFVKGMPPLGTGRTHHIWIYEDPVDFKNRILFRDYLRTHPDAALKYENLKLKLSETYSEDREAYTNAKTEFIAEIILKTRSSQL